MEHDLVSVVIPTYNRAAILPEAVDSVLAQTHACVEIVIVDDGSRDATAEVVRARYGHDPRVRYFHQPNGGVSAARNHGLRQVRGEFVAFLDSDDAWYPNKLALQVAALRAVPDAGMVWTDLEAVAGDGRPLYPRYLRRMYHAYRFFPTAGDIFPDELTVGPAVPALARELPAGAKVYHGDIFSAMALGSLVHTSTVLLRRERVERVGFFREDFRAGEDYDFHLRTCKAGPVAFVDVATIKYRIGHDDALTTTDTLRIAEAFLTTLEHTLKYDRARIRLPRAVVDECHADALAWVGTQCLARGKTTRARACLARSLSYRPWHPHAPKPPPLSLLPAALRDAAVALGRRQRARRRAERGTLGAPVAPSA
jgi:glycosyltransferase involved in cell wall biosynthesis